MGYMDELWPIEGHSLYDINDTNFQVHIKWSKNIKKDYQKLSEEFFECGYKICEKIVDCGHDNIKSDMWVFPSMYLFRQGMELGIKVLICGAITNKGKIQQVFLSCKHMMLYHYLCLNNFVYGLDSQSMPSLPIFFSNLVVQKGVPMALKIVYKICCGIDVHKTFVVACIASTNKKGITTYGSHRFSTYTKGLKDLLQWLPNRNCKDACMESTGKYWIPVYNVLENDCSVVLAHPKYVKAIRGKKTDKKNAKWIADLFKHDLVAGSFMPPADIRQLRDLMRYHFKLTCFKSSEKNRLQNCLTVSNIQLASVVSDTFGKSAQAILDKILENPADTSFDLEPLVYKSLKKKLPELRDAIDGYITPEQASKLKVIKSHYENLESRKAELEGPILALAAPYQQELAILQTAPGISSIFTAIGIISEIGTNMEDFPSARHLCSWAGLTLTNNESAGKKKSVRVSKAGCYIKPLLVQCANAVVKSKKHPEMRNRYLRLKKRRGHKTNIQFLKQPPKDGLFVVCSR